MGGVVWLNEWSAACSEEKAAPMTKHLFMKNRESTGARKALHRTGCMSTFHRSISGVSSLHRWRTQSVRPSGGFEGPLRPASIRSVSAIKFRTLSSAWSGL